MDVTKTPDTIKQYLFRGGKLWLRAADFFGILPENLQPTIFLDWLDTILVDLMPATRRLYLASIKEYLNASVNNAYLSTEAKSDLDAAMKRSMVMKSADYSKSQNNKPTPRRGRTSSQKAKRLDVEDIRLLRDSTKDSRSEWVLPGLLWLSANIAVGLRPSEWRYSQLIEIDDKPFLKVVNSKHTNGRAHGEYRHIDLSGLMQIEMMWLKLQLRKAQQYAHSDKEWNHYYNSVRWTIHHISREHLGNRRKFPSLYSSRHQFAANAKLEGLSKADIGAMMGHATDVTASQHYGRKIHGRFGFRSRPLPEEVDKVKCIHSNKSSQLKGNNV